MFDRLKDYGARLFIILLTLTGFGGFMYLVYCMGGWYGILTLFGILLFCGLFLWSIHRIVTRGSSV